MSPFGGHFYVFRDSHTEPETLHSLTSEHTEWGFTIATDGDCCEVAGPRSRFREGALGVVSSIFPTPTPAVTPQQQDPKMHLRQRLAL